jgi:hypothetical protein
VGRCTGTNGACCHDIIDRQITQMTHLMDDRLDASRLSRGQLRLRLARLNIRAAIEQVRSR